MAKVLEKAKKNKADEFYTQLPDIEAEMRHYKEHFRDKVVFCNCDDPFESNFFKYFAMNFNYLGLKKLISTCYAESPVASQQLSLFDVKDLNVKSDDGKRPHKIEITEVRDENADGAIDLADVEYLLKNKKNTLTLLDGDGDFRSAECIELLKEADIVATNPPFSLFREYIAQLVEYDKKFIIIGSKNAITYREIFKLIQEDKLWLGNGFPNGNAFFKIPEEYSREWASGVYNPETGLVKFRNVGWFTNLDFKQRHESITLYKQYSPEEYPHYDNYDAIEVSKVAEIPYDYDGLMGVPITFLDKYNPEQFEILGITQGRDEFGVSPTKWYINPRQINPDGTTSNGGKVNTRAQILLPHKPKGVYFIADNADGPLLRVYARILIKRKGSQQ
ncbi:MAG: adenine-specific methyltransferase EcoRI family protein [Anaerolineales bacterium]|nr:adenine-specific methyltransferase EcoRI family protein [Anaerolineales bacterium]